MQGQVREDVYFQQTDLQARSCLWTGGISPPLHAGAWQVTKESFCTSKDTS